MEKKPTYNDLMDALFLIREELADTQGNTIPLSVAYTMMAGRMRMIACLAIEGEDFRHIEPTRS